ncbi:MAG: peptidoglycan bridge formation glycyltransferase FemA/FemB family protein [Filomicrobium sp.]
MRQSALNQLNDIPVRYPITTRTVCDALEARSYPDIEVLVTDGLSRQWDRDLTLFNDSVYDQANFLGEKLWGPNRLSQLVLKQNGQPIAAAQIFLFQVTRDFGGGIAYAKFGPLWRPKGTKPNVTVYRLACQALIEEYAIRRKLCLTIAPGPDPVYGSQQVDVLNELGFVRKRDITAALRYMVDVNLDLAEQRKSLSSKWRYNLKKSEKNDIDVTFLQDDAARQAFRDLHEEMRARKNYKEKTWADEFDEVADKIPDKLRPNVVLARNEGRAVAGAVVGAIGDTAIYLFGGSSREGLDLRAGYLLQWEIIRKLTSDPDVRWYDLDNDAFGNPGLRQFKSGLVGRRGVIFELPGEFEYCCHRRSRITADLVQGLRQGRNLFQTTLDNLRHRMGH